MLACRIPVIFPKAAADHMTIRFRPDKEHVADLPLGCHVELQAFAVAADRSCQVLIMPCRLGILSRSKELTLGPQSDIMAYQAKDCDSVSKPKLFRLKGGVY